MKHFLLIHLLGHTQKKTKKVIIIKDVTMRQKAQAGNVFFYNFASKAKNIDSKNR